MNGTLLKFGYPDNEVFDYKHWTVLLRPEQVTLSSLILGYKGEQTAFSHVEQAAMSELYTVVNNIETTLSAEFSYDKINYMMLMMVDPHVHFHVIPRYCETVEFDGVNFEDFGWPGPPLLNKINKLTESGQQNLLSHLRERWTAEEMRGR